MFTELRQPLSMISPKGRALAIAVIDYGFQSDLIWVCVQCDTGELWCWGNRDVKMEANITMGIRNDTNNQTTD